MMPPRTKAIAAAPLADTAASPAAGAAARMAVLLPLPLGGAYDYAVPPMLEVAPGQFVTVPLGRRMLTGVAWGEAGGDVPEHRLRPIHACLPAPPLSVALRRFVDWVAAYTVQPPGAVLRMAMSVPAALLPEKPSIAYRLNPTAPTLAMSQPSAARRSAARERITALLADGPPRPATEIAHDAACSDSAVRTLVRAGVLLPIEIGPPPPPSPDWRRCGPVLSAAQRTAADHLRAMVEAGAFSVNLLDGVPGSGKTEVYFEAVAACLASGRQVLVLLPEIALGSQWRSRFRARFGAPPLEWHSDLGAAERRRTWRAVAEGQASLVVGARSALFLPFPSLGLIVVDEEHDSSFKQEDGVAYHARDMAVVRARLTPCPAVLVSATPSLETAANVDAGRYASLRLPERHRGTAAPAVEVIDLRRARLGRGAFIAPPLRAALVETLARGRQAMLFLNRRGYAPLTLCRGCGHRLHCPSCTAWLVEHRLVGRLQCHHCGYTTALPTTCPACGAADTLCACGPGVERLGEELAAVIPQARTALATSDTLGSPRAAADLVARMESGEIDLLVGTQIVAKGYHFPRLALVGVVDADLGLSGGDLRAAERTFQLLYQVAGRAGRSEAGRVVLQTCSPDHPVIRAMVEGDRDGFVAAEIASRRDAAMPPFGRLAALIVSSRDEAAADAVARALASAVPAGSDVRVLGPAPAPLALLRGRHRRRLLAHAPRAFALSPWVRGWLAAVRLPGSVRVQVDIDPQSFL